MSANVKSLFQALGARNYRLYFTGQGISLIGTWMQRTTMGWFVYRLTGSALLLGLIGFLSQIPSVFIGPFAGVWADKFKRLSILKITQSIALIQATTLGVLVLTHHIQIWHIVVLSLLQGITEAIDAPARQSLVIELIEKRSLLTNAIALNSAMFNGARLIGPSLAGIVIAVSNEGFCFLLNGFSYIAVLISLYMIKVPVRKLITTTDSMFTKIKQGWKYSFSHLPIRYLITNISVITMFGMSYAVLMPIFARDILHGDSKTMGFLMSMAGVGALVGAMYLASRKSIKGLTKRMSVAALVFSSALIVFSFSHNLFLSLGLMLAVGLGMMFQMATSNTIIQTVVDDDMRGRVMSLHSMAFMSVAPFGSLLVGFMSKHIGAPYTLSICAVICLLWGLYGITLQGNLARNINLMVQKHEQDADHVPSTADISELNPEIIK